MVQLEGRQLSNRALTCFQLEPRYRRSIFACPQIECLREFTFSTSSLVRTKCDRIHNLKSDRRRVRGNQQFPLLYGKRLRHAPEPV